MNLPRPFDFRDSNTDGPEGESTGPDLLESFYSRKHRRLHGPVQWEKDRRLNLMRHFGENDSDGDMTESCAISGKGLDPNSSLKFLGEQLVSGQELIN